MRQSLSFVLPLAAIALSPSIVSAETQPGPAQPQALYRVVKVSSQDVLNVRSGPSSAFGLTGQLPADSVDIKLEMCRGQWCQVSHAAATGWAYKGYLALQEQAPTSAAVASGAKPDIAAVRPAPAKPLVEKALSPPEKAFRFFVEQGWGEHHAAGIVGNLQAECGQMLNCSIGSGGIAQWRAERVTRFHKVFGYPFARAKFADQLAYIQWELTHPASPWKDSGRILKRATDAASAAALFDVHYERSAGTTRGARIANARVLLKRFGSRTASSG